MLGLLNSEMLLLVMFWNCTVSTRGCAHPPPSPNVTFPTTVSNVASRLCDEAKLGQILISPRVLAKVENAVQVEPIGEFELKGIRRPLAAYNVVTTKS